MAGWTKFTDMSLTDDEKLDTVMPIRMADKPEYPCGLRISLSENELTKLGLEGDCEIGDTIDLRALAKVTSVSANETETGRFCRVELQIEQMAVEIEDEEAEMPKQMGMRYAHSRAR